MTTTDRPLRLLVHAGAGNISADSDLATIETEIGDALRAALEAGNACLCSGGDSVDAVVEAVRLLEDCPLFNAGRGSVLTRDGTVEMDAAVVDGASGNAGAVACVTKVRNPVLAARAVIRDGMAVLLCGAGADSFAADAGCATEAREYFVTDYWRERWLATRGTDRPLLDHTAGVASGKHGTVGAVALDGRGALAAATSTGGLLHKSPGRISDSALPGAGTHADRTIALSFTGTGEHIIRLHAGVRLAYLIENGLNLGAAAERIIAGIGAIGGEAGLIALDRTGRCAIRCNTTHMLRGWIGGDGIPATAIAANLTSSGSVHR